MCLAELKMKTYMRVGTTILVVSVTGAVLIMVKVISK